MKILAKKGIKIGALMGIPTGILLALFWSSKFLCGGFCFEDFWAETLISIAFSVVIVSFLGFLTGLMVNALKKVVGFN